MTPEAVEVVAQVNAAVMIALVIESKSLAARPEDMHDARRATSHTIGLMSSLAAIFMSFSSVINDHSLDRWQSEALGGLTVLPMIVLLNAAMVDLRPQRAGVRHSLITLLFMLALTVWILFYWRSVSDTDDAVAEWFRALIESRSD